MHFSDNKLDAKFVTNNGATLDHFSISKTVKKKIIERISDNIVTDTKSKEVSDKVDTKAKPLSDKVDTKAKPLIRQKTENRKDKPVITYKLNDNTVLILKPNHYKKYKKASQL